MSEHQKLVAEVGPDSLEQVNHETQETLADFLSNEILGKPALLKCTNFILVAGHDADGGEQALAIFSQGSIDAQLNMLEHAKEKIIQALKPAMITDLEQRLGKDHPATEMLRQLCELTDKWDINLAGGSHE